MIVSDDKFCWVQLDDEALARSDQRSFHVCAEGKLSDFRTQIYNLRAGDSVDAPSVRWPNHLSVIVCINGLVDAKLPDRTIELRRLSQLVVLPGVACTLTARGDAALDLMSFNTAPANPVLNPSGLRPAG
jgi:hypothetical protein